MGAFVEQSDGQNVGYGGVWGLGIGALVHGSQRGPELRLERERLVGVILSKQVPRLLEILDLGQTEAEHDRAEAEKVAQGGLGVDGDLDPPADGGCPLGRASAGEHRRCHQQLQALRTFDYVLSRLSRVRQNEQLQAALAISDGSRLVRVHLVE